jgi:hypothetical protein
MSLPTSERLPNDINELPPARQRHIRRQPRSATAAERQILLDSLVRLTAPTPTFFMRTLLGALALGAALYLQDIVILVIAIVALPFVSPLFGLAVFPGTLNFRQAAKAITSLLILFAFSIAAGALAGMLTTLQPGDPLRLFRFSGLYWLDVTLVAVSAFMSVLILLREGIIPRGLGVLLSYTLLVPLAVVGFGLTHGRTQLWLSALLVSFTHLGLAVVIAALTILVLGFPPQKTLGWLLLVAALMITLAVASGSLHLSTNQRPNPQPALPSPTRLMAASSTPSLQATPTDAPEPTATSATPATLTPTEVHSPTSENTPTSTPEPRAYWGVINADIGAVIREGPGFDSPIVDYANNGDQLEILGQSMPEGGQSWYQVQTASGLTGWLLGSLIQTLTPTPTQP